ncbi:MAG: hypothetical protein R6V01_01710 [Thermoplasmatota archaeon]
MCGKQGRSNEFFEFILILVMLSSPYFLYTMVKKHMKGSCLGIKVTDNEILFNKPFIGNLTIKRPDIKNINKKSNDEIIITTNNDVYKLDGLSKDIVRILSNISIQVKG